MCVIVVKPSGVKTPSKETLIKCALRNKDGIGYMFTYNETVYIRKGFMDYKSFFKDLEDVKKEYKIKDFKDIPMVFHFRITTQGGVHKEICHPYPVCDNYETMRLLNSTCRIGMAHNGIISLTSEYGATGMHYDHKTNTFVETNEPLYNDTMTFIKDYASLIVNNDIYFARNKAKCEVISNLIGTSRLAFLNERGFIKLFGEFYKIDGIYYSNLLWCGFKKKKDSSITATNLLRC